jgi:membrane fusion protein, multidrug efflux system
VLLGVVFYFSGGRVVSTDDAYVKARRVDISARIGGSVASVDVKENQHVHKGQKLFELDRRARLIDVQDATARLNSAKLQVAALKATYRQRRADVQAAESSLAFRTRELKRQRKLAAGGVASQAQLERARNAYDDARQGLAAARQKESNALALLGGDADIDVDAHPAVQQAKAALDKAQLNLSYTVVDAPMDGIVSGVDRLQAGEHINANQPLFALSSDKQVWVEANFKETALTYMRPGQLATIHVDEFPRRSFHGRVDSFSPGTGASFSLLPPENATGNWIKVVQRVPVRIRIDDPDARWPLSAGLSATVDVDTHHSRLAALLP